MASVEEFFKILFEAGESINCGPTNYVTSVFPVAAIPDYVWRVFFSINPLKAYSTRADRNVTVFRNILVEIDSMPTDEQYLLIERSGLPYSTCVYSGNKSLHFIISLAEPFADRKAYDACVKRVYKALGGKQVVDVACANPSRQSRYPNAERPETKKVQHLLEVKTRVPNADLEKWLCDNGAKPEPPKVYSQRPAAKLGQFGQLRGSTLNFLMGTWNDGEWNIELFKASCDIISAGYSHDEAVEMLERVTGHLDRSDLATITSAQRRVERSG